MSEPVTILSLARHLGMSKATVSAVLANRHVERRLSGKTVERVRAAAKEFGYVPNMAGRRLRANSSAVKQIDLAVITSFEAPLPLVSHVLRTFQQEVDQLTNEKARFSVAVEMFHARRLSEVHGILDTTRFNGVLIANTLPEDDEFLQSAHLPYASVILGRRIPGYNCVLETPGVVGRNAASILAEAGARNIAILYGKDLTQSTKDRVDSFISEVRARIEREPVRVVSETLSAGDSHAAMAKFLREGGVCDGLFAVTDSLVQGAYFALSERGLQVSEDVAVVGVGDSAAPEFLTPPLTATGGDSSVVEAKAVGLLLQLLRGEKKEESQICVTPLPIIRVSSRLRKRI